ncbi:MAG: DUF6702 family protein [Daejeonella sp.]
MEPIRSTVDRFHPLHVSTLDVNYGSEGRLEVICTIFTDDFESALSAQFSAKTDLSSPAIHEKMDILVKKYIEDHLLISSNSKIANLRYMGFEKDREVINVYLESDKLPLPQKIEVQVSFLYNIFKDQMNILHVTVDKKRHSTKLDFPQKNTVFEYK